jgi:hypothetical protein
MERIRRSLWHDETQRSMFDPNTVLFTTHSTIMTWTEGQITRNWHHPRFDVGFSRTDLEQIRSQAVLKDVVFDEPEIDELIWRLPETLHSHLASVTRWDWTKMPNPARRELHGELRKVGVVPRSLTFEAYSELRYVQLTNLEQVTVNFATQPFGRENSARSIYRSQDGTPYYLGIRRWPFEASSRITFLTTETLTADTIAGVFGKARQPLLKWNLDQLPSLYPITVAACKDKRASAKGVQELAAEILENNANAVVIADGLKDLKGERAMTFQSMKGRNDLAGKDVYIIVTFLAPEVYGVLNVLGQWIGIADTVAKYYSAQISQAVGRNTGFRQQAATKTMVVISAGLLRLLGPSLSKLDNRFALLPIPDHIW